MAEKLKKIKLNVTLSAILTVVLGVVLLIYPESSILVAAKAIAAIIILVGALQLIHVLLDPLNIHKTASAIVALIILVFGVYLFFFPSIIVKIIPIIIGILLVVHGVQDLSLAVESKGYKADRWWLGLVFGLISILAGLYCIISAFKLVAFVTMITGIMLIYDGLSDMIVVHKVNKAARDVVDSKIISEEDIEDYK